MFGRVSKENGEIKENVIYLDGTGVLERISREVGVNNFRQKQCTIGHRLKVCSTYITSYMIYSN